MTAPRSRQQGYFHLSLPPDEAFDLFTPEGERRWVAGWDPVIVGDGDECEPGTVFLTSHGREQTIWTVIEADRSARRLVYSRVSPGRRAGTVRVELAEADGGTRARIAYDMTALGTEGATAVAAMDPAAFAAMLVEWQQLIERSLADLGD